MTTPADRRDGNGKITREAVLAAALEIIDRDGADALPGTTWAALIRSLIVTRPACQPRSGNWTP